MKTSIFAILLFISVAAFANPQSQAELSNEEIVEKLLVDPKSISDAESARFQISLKKEVISEIEDEAAKENLDRDAYVDASLSMKHFVSQLKAIDTAKLSRVQKGILFFKTVMRIEIQEKVNSIPDGHLENSAFARNFAATIGKELQGN